MNETIDFLVNQGADWSYVAFIQNDPVNPTTPTNPANAVNLSGCSAVMTAAACLGSPVNIFQLSTAAGTLVINVAAGSIAWNVPASMTSTFTPTGLPAPLQTGGTAFQMGFYTMKVTNAAGAVVREFSGKLYLNLDV
ncbi:hypothetical protein SAMN05216466_10755 [Paraburkholderia phenazinium]|uniref:Uncharacterized protein n=2 Tax=Paraburkholderia phenazinium TaxID=60549 RepID=A0A1G7ZL28_9BURK|nr:hypothetical protein SAMN05216466_10755 [Paraburkholderia phenazinium]